jgi:hypothetical protein
MRWKDVNLNPDVRVLRQFGGLSACLCAGAAIWQAAMAHRTVPAILFSVAAVLLTFVALVRPNLLRGIFVASIVATFPIGWVVSNLVLFCMYFGLLTPLAFAFRWSGRDLLNLRPARDNESSFWNSRRTSIDQRSYFKQF